MIHFLLQTNLVPYVKSVEWKIGIWWRPSLTAESVQALRRVLLVMEIIGLCSTTKIAGRGVSL